MPHGQRKPCRILTALTHLRHAVIIREDLIQGVASEAVTVVTALTVFSANGMHGKCSTAGCVAVLRDPGTAA